MCQVFYSINSHRKIVHYSNCAILSHIPKENIRSFYSLQEAQAHGYHLCKCCPPIAHKYRKERHKIKDFCHTNGLTVKLQDGAIHIISRHDCWRIITNGHNHNIFLYHKNTGKRCRRDRHPPLVPGFHSQKIRASTILEYLEYIVGHDLYRDDHPCTERVSHASGKKWNIPDWLYEKYGPEYFSNNASETKPMKGTKRYKKEQARKKRQKRRAAIIRVNALLDELAVIG